MIIRCYSELRQLKTFEERYEYLKLSGHVGIETFGIDRYLNQMFYKLDEWLEARDKTIYRDNGCDLGIEGYDINKNERIIIHHMNSITVEQILDRDPSLFNHQYLITTVLRTHNAIHYGSAAPLQKKPVIRTKNDTCPWRR